MPIKECWAHLTEVFPPQPRIRVHVINLTGLNSLSLNVMVDTGFSGYLSLHGEAVRELNLEPLGSGELSTIEGATKAKIYLAKIEIIDSEGKPLYEVNRYPQDNLARIDGEIKSLEQYPTDAILIHELGLPLIGLRCLLTRNWVIFNSHNAFCLLK